MRIWSVLDRAPNPSSTQAQKQLIVKIHELFFASATRHTVTGVRSALTRFPTADGRIGPVAIEH
ncbi:MAG: hypothetical protein ACFCUO_09185 [Rhodospirillales bacterium]